MLYVFNLFFTINGRFFLLKCMILLIICKKARYFSSIVLATTPL